MVLPHSGMFRSPCSRADQANRPDPGRHALPRLCQADALCGLARNRADHFAGICRRVGGGEPESVASAGAASSGDEPRSFWTRPLTVENSASVSEDTTMAIDPPTYPPPSNLPPT